MKEDTKYEELIKRTKNHRWISYIIFLAAVFLSIVSFVEGAKKAGEILGSAFSSKQLSSAYDFETKEGLIAVARDVDEFFLNVASVTRENNSQQIDIGFYIKVKADLRSIYLRNKIRPLNRVAIKQTELLLSQWNEVGDFLDVGITKVIAGHINKIMRISFESVLTLEEAKKTLAKEEEKNEE